MIDVAILVEITDPDLLRAYTSGFMPDDATLGDRVTKILSMGGHPIIPDINGVTIIDASYEELP